MRFRRSDTLGLVVCIVTLGTLLALITYSMQTRKAMAMEEDATQQSNAPDPLLEPAAAAAAAASTSYDPYSSSSSSPSPFMLLIDLSIILLSWCFFFLVSWIFFYRKLFQDYEVRMIHSVQVSLRDMFKWQSVMRR
jgi:hypothetical protein